MEKLLPGKGRYDAAVNHFEDDDFIDRLNNRWTVRALIMCVFVITGKLIIGDQINCWMPNEFGGPHIVYANSICWLKGSYYLPTEEITIPDRSKPRTYFISYYQWTPFILLGMALFFLFPRFLWHALPRQGGVNIRRLVGGIKDDKDPEKGLDIAQRTLKLYLDTQTISQRTLSCCYPCRKYHIVHTSGYFGVKLLYITNTMGQFFLLNKFLSFHFTSYGVEALKRLYNGEDWFESPRFPRITMCDFMVRRLGSNQHWYAVQCNLPINMYNEKIFLGIWIWLIILTILNILSIISWMISLSRARRSAAIEKYLKISRVFPMEKETLLPLTPNGKAEITDEERHYFLKYLHIDGYLIFRLIGRNTNEIVAGKIIKYLYKHYQPPTRKSDDLV